MSISSVGSNPSLVDLLRQRRQATKAMETAVQSGDLASAQQNLAVVQQDTQSIQASTGSGVGAQSGNPFQNPLKNDLTAIMNSVQAGDLTGAQSALQQFQADKQALQASAIGGGSQSANPQDAFSKDLSTLLTAVTSGDKTSMQNAATALQSDLQNLFGGQAASSSQTAGSTNTPGTANAFLSDLQSLISSAQSGDTAGAQQAVQKLQQDVQGAVGGTQGHHHHHHRAAASSSSTATSINSSPTGQNSDNSGVGSGGSSGAASGAALSTSTVDQAAALKSASVISDLLAALIQSPPQTAPLS
jgi:hypothetical protein